MRKSVTSYKNFEKEKKLYNNKIFSYRNVSLKSRNYSRKNFNATKSRLVSFINCEFEQTQFSIAKFENCLFKNCVFSNLEIYKVQFKDVTFLDCGFSGVLFNKCFFDSFNFKACTFKTTTIYPSSFVPRGFDMLAESKISSNTELNFVLKEALLNKYIRESNTLFKKTRRNNLSKTEKRKLLHIKPKEAQKSGLSKKERLAENARRKKQKKQIQQQSYQDSLLGKNRVIDKGILEFLLNKYSMDDLVKGLKYIIDNVDYKFLHVSYLIKLIDKGISV